MKTANEYYNMYTAACVRYIEKHNSFKITPELLLNPDSFHLDGNLCKDAMEHALAEIMMDMSQEVFKLGEEYKCKTTPFLLASVRVMNSRCNEVLDRIKNDSGTALWKHDTLIRYWIKKVPDLKKYLEVK